MSLPLSCSMVKIPWSLFLRVKMGARQPDPSDRSGLNEGQSVAPVAFRVGLQEISDDHSVRVKGVCVRD